ncbi:uncharacterized protein LOC129883537 [Solanum dulcamara]|uniref:uncharacterized protein LOC129883537 n=1 Tax=Solanum dulcamara TaxID=45834 RepID=UPI002485DC5B|nr:uncharacterized protein LOC129883537 [Solanum dulcamara]
MADFFHHMSRRVPDPDEMNFEKMTKMGGVEFKGTFNATDAEQWLEWIKRVFEQLEYSDAAKFKYDVSLLQKDAYDWWVSVPNARAKPLVLTWNDFVKKFHKKLSLYAGGIINNKKDKCKRFKDDSGGPSKRERFDSSTANTFRKLSQHKQNRSSFSMASTPSYGQGKTRIPTCAQCGKNHFGTCRRASRAYFNCGSFDHKVRDCLNPNPTSSPHMEGSVQKPVTTPSQGNKGARSRNTQATGTGAANPASGSRAIA